MNAKIYRTTETIRLLQEDVIFTERTKDNSNILKVFPHKKKQKIQGFGSSFTEGSGVSFNKMTEKTKEKLLDLYFGLNGSRYNLARLPIQSCDFSLKNYEYIKDESDLLHENFDFSHDDEYIIPFVKAALKVNPEIVFMASPWSPPAFMKTNQNMNKGGELKEKYYESWALIIKKYLDYYLENGIKIKKISVQNEPVAVKPWDSCLYTNENELLFAAKYLRTILKDSPHEDIQLYIWDHDKDGLIDWIDQSFSLDNQIYAEEIDGVAFHWYTGDHFEQINYLATTYPDKDLLFTEGCVPFNQEPINNHEHAYVYIHDLIGNFKNGTTGYIDWNILLDHEGGPNHMGNTCEAPILYQAEKDKLSINLSYYYINHFSHFIENDAHVILTSSYSSQIEHVGFINPNGDKIIVLYNNGSVSVDFRIVENEKECSLKLSSKEVATVIWQ